MTDLRKAAEQALNHLTNLQPYLGNGLLNKTQLAFVEPNIDEAMKELRQALAQPKKEWVGLTDQEIWDLGADHAIDLAWAREIEAKLKEKNV